MEEEMREIDDFIAKKRAKIENMLKIGARKSEAAGPTTTVTVASPLFGATTAARDRSQPYHATQEPVPSQTLISGYRAYRQENHRRLLLQQH